MGPVDAVKRALTGQPASLANPWIRRLGIAIACVLVTSVASVGQVRHELEMARQGELTAGPFTPGSPAGPDGATTVPGQVLDPATGLPVPGSTAPGETLPPNATAPAGPGTSAGQPPPPGSVSVPDFGLRTQGVSDTEVLVGLSWNRSGCGDAGTLTAALGPAVTGDLERSVDAFVRHINDTGGIGGRQYRVTYADDGGGGCEEKAGAAAVELVDDDKVFLVVPGLNTVADYAVSQHVPVYGGRDDLASTNAAGAGTFEPVEDLDTTLDTWASFGRYYLDSGNHAPCLIHPDTAEWNAYEEIAVAAMARYGLEFRDILRYAEDVATAQQQSNVIAARAKTNGCDQAWFLAYNPIALVFLTQAASNNLWFPTWTWTSFTGLVDTELAGRLMDGRQWRNAIGLSGRIPPGQHPNEGNCKRIYQQYYPDDGQADGAYVTVACYTILTTAEAMRRAVERTGVLTANSLMVGADAITNDFFYDAHVPMDFQFPSASGPFKQKGFSHYTVARWDGDSSSYQFPEYPNYWRRFGPDHSGGEDLRPMWGAS